MAALRHRSCASQRGPWRSPRLLSLQPALYTPPAISHFAGHTAPSLKGCRPAQRPRGPRQARQLAAPARSATSPAAATTGRGQNLAAAGSPPRRAAQKTEPAAPLKKDATLGDATQADAVTEYAASGPTTATSATGAQGRAGMIQPSAPGARPCSAPRVEGAEAARIASSGRRQRHPRAAGIVAGPLMTTPVAAPAAAPTRSSCDPRVPPLGGRGLHRGGAPRHPGALGPPGRHRTRHESKSSLRTIVLNRRAPRLILRHWRPRSSRT